MFNKIVGNEGTNGAMLYDMQQYRDGLKRPFTFGDISPFNDRSKYREKVFSLWDEPMPGFDLAGLLEHMQHLPLHARTREEVFLDTIQIVERFLWPPECLVLVLPDKEGTYQITADPRDRYKVDLKDFALEDENSIARYVLDNDVPVLFSFTERTPSEQRYLFRISGEPVRRNGEFPDYGLGVFSNATGERLNVELMLKDETDRYSAFLAPLQIGPDTRGLWFLMLPTFLCNGPMYEMPWYLKIFARQIGFALAMNKAQERGTSPV